MKKKIKDSLGNLKNKVVKASKVPVPEKPFKEGGTMLEEINLDAKKEGWVILVENFCNTEGITPLELIEAYKTKGKAKKVATIEGNKANQGTLQDFTKENAVGKPYNPQNNWLYKAKLAKATKQG